MDSRKRIAIRFMVFASEKASENGRSRPVYSTKRASQGGFRLRRYEPHWNGGVTQEFEGGEERRPSCFHGCCGSHQDRAPIDGDDLAGAEAFFHQIEIGACDVGSFADASDW